MGQTIMNKSTRIIYSAFRNSREIKKKKKLSVPVWLLFATAWLRLKKYNMYLYLSKK
jgi:hypothetical protein